MKMHFIVYFIGILSVLTIVKCNVEHVGKNYMNSSGNDDQDDDGILNGISLNIEEREINDGLPSSWKLRKNKCGKTKIACKEAGGKCQDKGDDCDGELLQGKKYCTKNNKCGCCVPEGLVTCEECKQTEDPCKVLGGKCQKKDATCDGNVIKGEKYCKPSTECTCCFPKDMTCVPKDTFKQKHVCDTCTDSPAALEFTKAVRGEPTFTVPANNVFEGKDIKYVYGVRQYDSEGRIRFELTCDMVDFVPSYYCCRTIKGIWKDCTGPENCKAKTRDLNGHLLEDTFTCK